MAGTFKGKRFNLAPESSKVISVEANPELLTLREAVLRKAGFKVVSTDDAAHAMREFRSGNYEAVVLSYSLGETALEQLTREFRKCCPQGRVVIITNEKMQFEVAENIRVVYGIDGPETLVNAIRAA